MGGAVFPPYRPNSDGVMVVMVTSFKTTYASCHSSLDYCIQCPRPCSRPLLTHVSARNPGHSQASLAQSLVGSLLLSPGSWCTHSFVCALQESVSPVLWKFCNQIPLASKVKLLGGSRSLGQIPRLENLLWVLELS